MAYVSVADATQPATSPITGMFNMPQGESTNGYIGLIADSDPRIATFFAAFDMLKSQAS